MDFANPPLHRFGGCPSPPQHHGLCLFSVHTGGSHADLTEQYAAIPAEMKAVAACFGQQALRQVPEDAFWAEAGKLRGQVPDRALCAPPTFSKKTGALPQCPTRWRKMSFPRYWLFSPRPAVPPSSFYKMPGRAPNRKNEVFPWRCCYPPTFCKTKAPAESMAGDLPAVSWPWRRRNWPLLISGKWKRHSDQTPAAGCTSVLPAREILL